MTHPAPHPVLNIEPVGDAARAEAIVREARHGLGRALRGADAIAVIGRAARAWREEPTWRERARAAVDSFSRVAGRAESERQMLEEVGGMLDAAAWERRISVELGFPRALDRPLESTRTEAILAYQPLGLVLHVAPGNSFYGGLSSLLCGFVTGNQNLVKLSRNVPPVAAIVVELLESCGMPRGQVRLLLWDAGLAPVEDALRPSVDGVVVWGGEAVIQRYQSSLPSGVRFLEHGPKLSFSVLTRQAAEDETALAALVDDVCRHEQLSCASSQLLFVEQPAVADAPAEERWRRA
jgi:acyl-CoA reductase-like NAD-dependent aldehyde dehydrogenase